MNHQVLVVDDSAIVREPIAAALRLNGFDAVEASDGKDALSKLKFGPFSLVLLDITMPRMDGLEFLCEFRRDSNNARIPVIVLTASGKKSHVVEVAKYGVVDYLLKPHFTLEVLITSVRRHIREAEDAMRYGVR